MSKKKKSNNNNLYMTIKRKKNNDVLYMYIFEYNIKFETCHSHHIAKTSGLARTQNRILNTP